MERTPRLIWAALARLPPPPDPWIIIGGRPGRGEVGDGAAGGEGVFAEEDGSRAVGGGKAGSNKPAGGPGWDAAGGCEGSGGKRPGRDAVAGHRGGQGGEGGGGGGEDGGAGRGGPPTAPTRDGQDDDTVGAGCGLALTATSNDQRYNPYTDLLLCGTPRSAIWKQAWYSRPLLLHDKYLVCAKKSVGTSAVVGGAEPFVDVSQEMTAILNNHPGPIGSFRVETSKWTHDCVIRTWLKILSNKSAAEVSVLNLGHETSTAFPIEEMQSPNLQDLRLGFMRIPDLDLLCFNYLTLQVIWLYCYSFQGLKLSWIIQDCVCLRELHIGFCTENLKVNSKSLELVEIWGTSAEWLVIECAPKLTVLGTSIMPRVAHTPVKQKRCFPKVSISINCAPCLKTMNHLLLPYHKITVDSIPIIMECAAWTSIEILKIGLNMSNLSQRDGLHKILDFVPKLHQLCILHLDKVDHAEGFEVAIDCPFDDINQVICVATCLESFAIQEFRGGPAELHMIQSVLRHAPCLLKLNTIPSRSCSQRQIRQATAEIGSYRRLSEACHVNHHSPNE